MSHARRIGWYPLVPLFLVACSSTPEPSVDSDPAHEDAVVEVAGEAETEEEAEAVDALSPAEAQREGYRMEDEGAAPVSDDVAFEEDRLPPAPEEVGGETIDEEGVEAQTVEELPAVEGDKIPPSVVAPVDPSVSAPVESRPAQGERGFRVQIGASTDRSGAEEMARIARTRTQEPVYVSLENPYYKVRVGDFTDRGEALQHRDRLRANGYPEAWVVTTTIRPPGP
jgi:cell division protein FtsN